MYCERFDLYSSPHAKNEPHLLHKHSRINRLKYIDSHKEERKRSIHSLHMHMNRHMQTCDTGNIKKDSPTCKVSMTLSISLPSRVPSLLSSISSNRTWICWGRVGVCKPRNNRIRAFGARVIRLDNSEGLGNAQGEGISISTTKYGKYSLACDIVFNYQNINRNTNTHEKFEHDT